MVPYHYHARPQARLNFRAGSTWKNKTAQLMASREGLRSKLRRKL
jgi:hypothetical protein